MNNLPVYLRNAINSFLRSLGRDEITVSDDQDKAGLLLTKSLANPIYLPGDKADLSWELRRRMLPMEDPIRCTHFIPSKHVVSTVKNREIYLRPMTLQTDVMEYEHAYAEAFAFWPLQTLRQQINGEWNAARAAGRDIYIFCLTDRTTAEDHKHKFWMEYGSNGAGVRLDLTIRPAVQQTYISLLNPSRIPTGPGFSLSVGKVIYDNGVLFDNYKEFRTALLKYGVDTQPRGFANIALRYKRERFNWEDEIRITLDTVSDASLIRRGDHKGYMSLAEENRKRAAATGVIQFDPPSGTNVNGVYLKMDNPWFIMTIEAVECGPQTDSQVVLELRQLCYDQGIPFTQAKMHRPGILNQLLSWWTHWHR